jgi:spore coat protein H
MIRYSTRRASFARLLPVTLALGALHCDGGATIIVRGAPAPELPAPSGPDLPGDPGGDDGPGSTPSEDEPPPSENGEGDGPLPIDPSNGDPSNGGPSVPPLSMGACQPRGAGGPFWLTEQDTVQIVLECGTGLALPGDAFQVQNLPPNAVFDPASRTLTFTPGLDQAGVYALDIGISGASERGQVEVQVADRFDAPGNVAVDPTTYTEEFGLPVLHLSVDPAINGEDYLPATITYRGHTFEGAEAKFRGTTSIRYPKKSFTLKFTKADRFAETIRLGGFTEKRKITLTTTFDDNSHLRARLAYELWNRIGAAHVQVRGFNAVAYVNGEFAGMYLVADHIDRHLMEDSGLFQDGNLYKARTHDANFRLTRFDDPQDPKLSLSEGLTKEEGTPLEGEPGATADLEALVRWVATATPELFEAELGARVMPREYEDWWLLVSLISAGDSAGKNSYHYRDPRPEAPDARFHVVPWDFNDSFGQTWYTDRAGREASRPLEELASYNLLFERLLAGSVTREPLLARYGAVLANEWELGSVLQSFDRWAAENETVALRDESKWAASYAAAFADYRSSFTTHVEELAYVRQWIVDRWTFASDYY